MKSLLVQVVVFLLLAPVGLLAQPDTVAVTVSHIAVKQTSESHDGHTGSTSGSTSNKFNHSESAIFQFDSMVRRADTVAFLKKGDRLPSRYCLIATFDTVTWAIKSVNLVTGIAGTPAFASDPCLNITTSKGILSNQGAHPTFTARGHDLDSPSTNIHSHRWQQLAGASYYWEMNNSLPSQPDSATVEIAFITHTPLSVQRPSHTTPQIALYPNPVNSVLHCLFSPGEPPIALMLTDLLGRVVRARTPAIGNGALEIDCSDLPAGSYLLRGIGLGQIVVVQHQ